MIEIRMKVANIKKHFFQTNKNFFKTIRQNNNGISKVIAKKDRLLILRKPIGHISETKSGDYKWTTNTGRSQYFTGNFAQTAMEPKEHKFFMGNLMFVHWSSNAPKFEMTITVVWFEVILVCN